MWSLFPQTSSGNLNNSFYLPPAAFRRMAARAPGWEWNAPSGVQNTQTVAGSAESRLAFRGTRRTQRPGERHGAREAGTGKGDGSREAAPGLAPASQQAGLGICLPHPLRSRAGPAPAPGPRPPAPPQQRALAGARGAPRYLGSDPAGRSPRRCHSALCETDTQLQLGFARRPAAATLAPASAPNRSPSPGPGGGKGQGSRAPGGRERGLQRAYLVFGGSSASGRGRSPPYWRVSVTTPETSPNRARTPSPPRAPRPPPAASPPPLRGGRRRVVPALPGAWRERGADPGFPWGSRLAHPSARLGARGRSYTPGPPSASLPGGGISHEGNPIDGSSQRGGCFPSSAAETVIGAEEAGMRPHATCGNHPAPFSVRLSSPPFLLHQWKRCLFKNKAAHGFNVTPIPSRSRSAPTKLTRNKVCFPPSLWPPHQAALHLIFKTTLSGRTSLRGSGRVDVSFSTAWRRPGEGNSEAGSAGWWSLAVGGDGSRARAGAGRPGERVSSAWNGARAAEGWVGFSVCVALEHGLMQRLWVHIFYA